MSIASRRIVRSIPSWIVRGMLIVSPRGSKVLKGLVIRVDRIETIGAGSAACDIGSSAAFVTDTLWHLFDSLERRLALPPGEECLNAGLGCEY